MYPAVAAGGCVPLTYIHTYVHTYIHTYIRTHMLHLPQSTPPVIEVFYEIFKVSGQTPNTVDINYTIELASMDNYVEPCDYKGYRGHTCT